MSVADILKKIGDWTPSKSLVKVVSEQLKVVEKTAYRKIKKEVEEGSIRRIPLPDRSVVYGLSNWPLKEDDLKLLIEALKANALQTAANAAQTAAMAKLIEAMRGS